MKCAKCGREMELEEKDTSSGRDMRTYYCQSCKERVDIDNGIASGRCCRIPSRRNDPTSLPALLCACRDAYDAALRSRRGSRGARRGREYQHTRSRRLPMDPRQAPA